jgi:hypothetical protein
MGELEHPVLEFNHDYPYCILTAYSMSQIETENVKKYKKKEDKELFQLDVTQYAILLGVVNCNSIPLHNSGALPPVHELFK